MTPNTAGLATTAGLAGMAIGALFTAPSPTSSAAVRS